MAIQTVTIEEYGSAPVSLAPEEYRHLRARYSGRLEVSPTDTPGTYRLTAHDHVGRVRLSPALLVVIRPKLPVANLLHMLATASGPAWFHLPNIALDFSRDAPTLLASALVAEVERILRMGLHTDFTPREADLPVVRGRIMLGRQVARHGEKKHLHSCAYVERTPDAAENRVLLAALLCLLPLLSTEEGTLMWKARTLLPAFADVDRLTPSQATSTLRALRIHRQNARYAGALSLCSLILNNLSIADRAGKVPFASYLVDLPRLFETFLTVCLRAHLPGYGLRVVAQRHDYLDEGGRVRIRPDILVFPLRGSTPLLVVDAKYRSPGSGGEQSADLYQLGAYVGRYGLTRGALVYPQRDPASPNELRLRGAGKELHTLALDLSSPTVAGLEEESARLAGEIASLATREY